MSRLCHLERARFGQLCDLVVLEPDIQIPEYPERNDFSHAAEMIDVSRRWTEDFLRGPNATALRPWIGRELPAPASIPAVGGSANACDCGDCQWEDCCSRAMVNA